MSSPARRLAPVTVFDAALPPGVATIRSLGRASVPVNAYSPIKYAPGRFSRFIATFETCPDPTSPDRFIEWLCRRVEAGEISLVAPTSDYVSYAVAVVEERLGVEISGGVGGAGGADAVRDCLFKDRFAARLDALGFPVPAWAAPTDIEGACLAAERIGYPVVVKPRSHVGVGVERGTIVRDQSELAAAFVPLGDSVRLDAHHAELAMPMLQEMISGESIDCVSITGCLGRNGELLGSGAIVKLEQWGGHLEIGTRFEAIERPSFAEHSIELVRSVLGTGIFELELLVDRSSGRYVAIDLNPRGYGQMALDIGRGTDLPALWYESATRTTLRRRPATRPPQEWRMGTPYYAGIGVRMALGPDRASAIRQLAGSLVKPSAGAMHLWNDPGPGLALSAWILRHPGGLIRPHVRAARAARCATNPQEQT